MEGDYKPLPCAIAREAVSAALAHARQCEHAYGQACAERARWLAAHAPTMTRLQRAILRARTKATVSAQAARDCCDWWERYRGTPPDFLLDALAQAQARQAKYARRAREHAASWQARTPLDAKVQRLHDLTEQALRALQGKMENPAKPEPPNLLWDWELAQGGVHATGDLPHANLRGVRSEGARALPYRPPNGGKAIRGAPKQSNAPRGAQWPT